MTYPQTRIWIPSLRFGNGIVARYDSGSGYESFVRDTECRSVISWKNLIKQKTVQKSNASLLWVDLVAQ